MTPGKKRGHKGLKSRNSKHGRSSQLKRQRQKREQTALKRMMDPSAKQTVVTTAGNEEEEYQN